MQLSLLNFYLRKSISNLLIFCAALLFSFQASALFCSSLFYRKPPEVSFVVEVWFAHSLGTVILRDPDDPRFLAQGSIKKENGKNVLRFFFVLRDSVGKRAPNLRGAEAAERIVEEFRLRGIEADLFEASWNDYLPELGSPSDNFLDFAQSYHANFVAGKKPALLPKSIAEMAPDTKEKFRQSLVLAAKSTWTGAQMRPLDFSHLQSVSIREGGGYRNPLDNRSGSIEIHAVWGRKKEQKEVLVSDPRSPSGSSLPRFHEILNYWQQSRK